MMHSTIHRAALVAACLTLPLAPALSEEKPAPTAGEQPSAAGDLSNKDNLQAKDSLENKDSSEGKDSLQQAEGRTLRPETKGQKQPQGWTGPIETESGGAPASSPQGQSPPGMQAAPEGSSKTTVEPDAKADTK